MSVHVYLIAALAVMVALAGAGYKGFQLGRDAEKAANVAREAAAREAVEAQRQADADKARKTAQTLQAALIKQKRLATDLGDSLAKHIAAMPQRVDCDVTDGVLNDLNRALSGAKDDAGGKLPTGSGSPAPADREKPGSADKEAR